jgi:hypothetical protein
MNNKRKMKKKKSTWILFNGPNLFSSHTFLSPNFTHSSLGKLQGTQTFPLCFLLTVLTVNLAKSSHQSSCHNLNAGLP